MARVPWKLLSMRDGVTLFGNTEVPRWTAQEISKAAGSLPSLAAISLTVESSTTLLCSLAKLLAKWAFVAYRGWL